MLNADQIKVRFIDELLKSYNLEIIASEVSFFQGYRKADLVCMKDRKTIAFEVKSDRDKVYRINDQLKDYKDTFQFCYLLTTKDQYKKIVNTVPYKVGVIIINDDQKFVTVKQAIENKRLSKHSLVSSINNNKINKVIKTSKHSTINDKRKYLEEHSTLDNLNDYFIETLKLKYMSKFKKFLNDRGQITTLTDLYYLQSI